LDDDKKVLLKKRLGRGEKPHRLRPFEIESEQSSGISWVLF
jgi:hypothetical protein